MKRSRLWTAAWARTPRTCCGTAAISTCAGRTACSPISWPWWWTMPAWASPKWCAGRPSVLHGAAAVPVPSAGPAGSSLCPLPAAAGPGRAAAVQAGRRPEPGKSAHKIHRAGDRGQACLRLRPAAGACAPHAGKPDRGVFLGKGAKSRMSACRKICFKAKRERRHWTALSFKVSVPPHLRHFAALVPERVNRASSASASKAPSATSMQLCCLSSTVEHTMEVHSTAAAGRIQRRRGCSKNAAAVIRQQQRHRVEHMDGRAHVGGGIGAVQRPHGAGKKSLPGT